MTSRICYKNIIMSFISVAYRLFHRLVDLWKWHPENGDNGSPTRIYDDNIRQWVPHVLSIHHKSYEDVGSNEANIMMSIGRKYLVTIYIGKQFTVTFGVGFRGLSGPNAPIVLGTKIRSPYCLASSITLWTPSMFTLEKLRENKLWVWSYSNVFIFFELTVQPEEHFVHRWH